MGDGGLVPDGFHRFGAGCLDHWLRAVDFSAETAGENPWILAAFAGGFLFTLVRVRSHESKLLQPASVSSALRAFWHRNERAFFVAIFHSMGAGGHDWRRSDGNPCRNSGLAVSFPARSTNFCRRIVGSRKYTAGRRDPVSAESS